MTILIVDDFANSRLVLQALLKSAGYTELLTVASAQDAFEQLGVDGTSPRQVEIDLILMDITMPEMDGIEACRRIKAVPHLRDLPIIMVTGLGEERFLDDAFAAGATDYMTKSVGKTELEARVRSALTLKQEMDARKLAYIELEKESMAKSQILSTVTHELKTPLTSIVGYTDRMLLRREAVGPLNDRQERYLASVQGEAYRLKTLIDDLLDISRMEANSLELKCEELAVQPEIDHAIHSVKDQFAEKQIHAKCKIPPGLGPIKADQLRLSQVIINLLTNAYKYSSQGAKVTVTAEELDGAVQIGVSDTGMGISKADQVQLFTKFFRADNTLTRRESGSGLGLFITRLLVEAQGGEIWVESEEGKGSTFSFTVPQAEEGPPQENSPAPQQSRQTFEAVPSLVPNTPVPEQTSAERVRR